MERLDELNLGTVENFDRIAARVVELEDFEDMALGRLVVRADAEFDPGR